MSQPMSALPNPGQAFSAAGGATATNQNVVNNNYNNNLADIAQLQEVVGQMANAIGMIPSQIMHQFNGNLNANINGLGGMSEQMQQIARNTFLEALSNTQTGNDSMNRYRPGVLG